MIHLLGQVPQKIHVAFSGGVDSLCAAHFLKERGREVTLLHFNHGCEYSDAIEAQCIKVASDVLGLELKLGTPETQFSGTGSIEKYWRDERYQFFKNVAQYPVITCHHLDDAVESWVWSSLHGNPHLIKPDYTDVIRFMRPLLLNPKQTLVDYCTQHSLDPVPDPVSKDLTLTRNYMRAQLLPHAYHVNPGLRKVIKKKYLQKG